MASIPVTITGVLADKYGRTLQAVTLFGELARSDVGIGGGPIVPEPPPEGGKPPDHIWGPTDPRPTPPIAFPPGWVGGVPPIVPVPPDKPNVPPPGSPPVIVGGTAPVNPIVPPPAVVIEYPGVGKVVVPQPTTTVPGPSPA